MFQEMIKKYNNKILLFKENVGQPNFKNDGNITYQNIE